jgi:hypothetical protein
VDRYPVSKICMRCFGLHKRDRMNAYDELGRRTMVIYQVEGRVGGNR